MTVLDGLLSALACGVLVPFAVLAVETVASLFAARRVARVDAPHSPVAILIPAHNEEAGVAATVRALLPYVKPGDRVLVVADNCSDGTAAAARSAGADVVERFDPARRGKGYALEFGVQHLAAEPPAVVVVLDADCRMADGCLEWLRADTVRSGSPVQALYLLKAPDGDDRGRRRLSRFAFLFKNKVRPLGLHRLGLPCLLTGTGMAFPWHVIRNSEVGTGNIVEDMKLGVDLSLQGHCPRLCPEALVEGDAPPHNRAAFCQRTRWEHGHVRTLLTQAPRLLWGAARQGRPRLLALALELSVPPLSLLMITWACLTAAAAWWRLEGGSALPVALLTVGAGVLAATVLAAWGRYGRAVLPATTLCLAPLYVLWKVPLYARLLLRPQRGWVRTDRHPVAGPPGSAPVRTESPV